MKNVYIKTFSWWWFQSKQLNTHLFYCLYRIYTPIFLKWSWCGRVLENWILIHSFLKQRWQTSVNLLVRKVMWFMLTTTSAPLMISRAFGANHMTRVSHIYLWLAMTHSLTFWLPETAWLCQLVTQLNTCNMGVYILCDFFLSCSAFLAGWVPISAHSLRHFVKIRKRQMTNMGENMSS